MMRKQECEDVILFFSVNGSGHFQGYAKMTSVIGRQRASNLWGESSWGGTFDLKWLKIQDLPFSETVHLSNPLNENKMVKISRDGQELPSQLGDELMKLFHKKIRSGIENTNEKDRNRNNDQSNTTLLSRSAPSVPHTRDFPMKEVRRRLSPGPPNVRSEDNRRDIRREEQYIPRERIEPMRDRDSYDPRFDQRRFNDNRDRIDERWNFPPPPLRYDDRRFDRDDRRRR
eukprot:TRINITY_DN2250_c0_g1_i1.p2 TRINITY_DN2250_c0_g1~~TRINITY_DN2250_c0_g1_i1.p2  ORF type:complete len:229 (+),score=64.53 TRINITY_DN2250_c0_g1_i1:12-698(+)